MPSSLDDLYEKLYAAAKAKHVYGGGGEGDQIGRDFGAARNGKRFADEKQLQDWIGGVGHGFEEHFRRGAWYDDDPLVRMLSRVSRTRAYGKGSGGWNPGKYVFGDQEYTADSFMPHQGETYEDWLARSQLGGTLDDATLRQLYGSSGANAPDPAAAQQNAQQAGYEQWRDQTMGKLDAFARQMNLPVKDLLEQGDWGAMTARNAGINGASSQALASGVGGGLSNMNSERATADALGQYQMQRQGMGLQAYNSLMGGLQATTMGNEDRRRYEQGMNLQMQNAQAEAQQRAFAERQGQNQQFGSLAGGVIGGWFGGPGGAQFGSQLGGSLGGATAGTYQPYQYHYPTGNSKPGSGGGGLGGYGGIS